MASFVDLGALDREVRAASALLHARPSGDAPSPLANHRRVSSRATLLELRELPSDPWIAGLRRWVEALTLARVLWPDVARAERAREEETVRIDRLDRELSVRDAVKQLLREEAPEMREVFARALERGATRARDAAKLLWERRAEASSILGGDDAALLVPCTPATAIDDIASCVADIAAGLGAHASWYSAVEHALAREPNEGWPPKVSLLLHSIVEPTRVGEGIRPSIDVVPLVSASSYAFAFGSFGESLASQDAPASVPFAVAYAPFDLRVARRRALFASIVAEPAFHRRVLKLGRDRANDQARSIGRSFVTWLRLAAAKVLVRGAPFSPSRFEEITAHVVGARIPSELVGVLPRLGPRDASSFLGALLAFHDRAAIVDRFDEDWFVSPHAARAIREEDSVIAPHVFPEEAFAPGLDALSRAVRALA